MATSLASLLVFLVRCIIGFFYVLGPQCIRIYILGPFDTNSTYGEIVFNQFPYLIDDEADESDLEGNAFVAPLDNPIFVVFYEDDTTLTADPIFDEYDDKDEPIFDSYVKEAANKIDEPIFDVFDDGDAKIETKPIFYACDEDLKITYEQPIFDITVKEKELVRVYPSFEEKVSIDEIVTGAVIVLYDEFVDIFLKDQSNGFQVNTLEAVTTITEFFNFHDLTLFYFSNILAFVINGMKGKIRG
ncbi:hypothetical protein PTKIN_Ptkin10aG0042800 [Pterospermum kingtungense]